MRKAMKHPRFTKRQMKKIVLAVALDLYRNHEFPVRETVVEIGVGGNYSRVHWVRYAGAYAVLDELLNAVAMLEGDRP